MEILASHSSESWSKVGKRLPPEQGCNEAGAQPLFPSPFPFLPFPSPPLHSSTPSPILAVQSPRLATHQIKTLDVDVIMPDSLLNPPSYIISIFLLFLRTKLSHE